MLWALLLIFYAAHWEKFVTGVLYLPWTYDAGMFALALLYLATAFIGSNWWTAPIIGSISAVKILRYGSYILLAQGLFSCFYKVYVCYTNGNTDRTLKEILVPIFTMGSFLLVSILFEFSKKFFLLLSKLDHFLHYLVHGSFLGRQFRVSTRDIHVLYFYALAQFSQILRHALLFVK